MSEMSDVDPGEICARKVVTPADVLAMRRGYYRDGYITEAEADALFAIEQSCPEQCPEWSTLFVEALTDYVVNEAKPQGYVTRENVAWLKERATVDGLVQTRNELELTVHVLEEARWSPAELSALALAQVRRAIVEAAGPLRPDGKPGRGVVTASDVGLLRRILYAFAGDGNVAITRPEAEVLFDINDAADEVASDPSWCDLFAKAVANHLMATSGYTAPTRKQALHETDWLESRPGATGFLTGMVVGGLKGIWQSYAEPDAEDLALARLEEQRRSIVVDEAVTTPEAAWLAERIGRDGRMSQGERGLLRFIKAESPRIAPELKSLLEKAA